MQFYKYPEQSAWKDLCKRNLFAEKKLDESVRQILQKVKKEGDRALFYYTEKFDNLIIDSLTVGKNEIEEAEKQVPPDLKKALHIAKENIRKFHAAQAKPVLELETAAGVKCSQKNVPIEKVGLYIPGGTAPLFSSVLMLAEPAKIAGCKEISLCTPPQKNGKIHPAILYAAKICGINNIIKAGGAQAIAAMAYGTESVPKTYKIFGPGNQFVTKAKEIVQTEGIAIDMPAGPSELLVIADTDAVPEFAAADLLSQAEHGADSQVILLSPDEKIIEQTLRELEKQLAALPRKQIAEKALENSRAILLNDMDECFAFSNYYAPEHLIIASENANKYTDKLINAGCVFVGNYSTESFGDYSGGTNHTLPTNAYAKNYSGVSLDSFFKKITFLEVQPEGINQIGTATEIMAEAEDLFAHKNAVSIRKKSLKKD